MFQDTTGQNYRALQAFTSLLKLVDALAAIPDQKESEREKIGRLPITLTEAGAALADILYEVLNCHYVSVIALDPPNDQQRLLGASGLDPEEKQILNDDTMQVPLKDYIDEVVSAQLHANQTIIIDLQQRPFRTSHSTHGARYRLVVPMILHGQLIGFFTLARTDAAYPTIDLAYTSEEIALVKGIAKLAAQLIERVSLLQEQVHTRANEQKLQEANRLYEDILTATSHELRTPLTTIKGNVQLALRRATTLEKRGAEAPLTLENIQRIEQPLASAMLHFAKMERMIREMLDDSRIQAGKFTMLMQTFNLVDIVRREVANIQRLVSERTVLLSLPSEEYIAVFADATRIGEVINNYLSNALKYAPASSPIQVKMTLEDSSVCISVQDEGPGIAYKDQIQIWKRFRRVDGLEPPEELGYIDANLGLGLYLSEKIIELHHGQVGVDSSPGQGATFWFTLALAPVLAEP
jgi:signal transduction histidine kinase